MQFKQFALIVFSISVSVFYILFLFITNQFTVSSFSLVNNNNNSNGHCIIEKWNNITTNKLPHTFSRWLWMKLNLSHDDNMNTTTMSILGAYVYPDYISVTITSQYLSKKHIICRYFDCSRKELIGSSWKSVVFPESVVYCPRRKGARYVSLTEKNGEKPQTPVALTFRAYRKPVHEYTVCVAPLYGDEPKWLQIVEFVEHYKLQGATYFYFYIGNVTDYDRRILNDYVRTGDIELIHLQDKYERPFFSWHLLEIQDCHQRSKYHSKWTTFVDIDERIEAKKGNTVEYLRSVDDSVGEIQIMAKRIIKSEDVPPKYINKKELKKEMLFRKYTNSSVATWKASKPIIRSDKIGIMSIHYAVALNPGYKTIRIDSTKAVLKHYRNTKFRMFGANWENDETDYQNLTQHNMPFYDILSTKVSERVGSVYERVNVNCSTISSYLWKSRQMIDPCKEKPESF